MLFILIQYSTSQPVETTIQTADDNTANLMWFRPTYESETNDLDNESDDSRQNFFVVHSAYNRLHQSPSSEPSRRSNFWKRSNFWRKRANFWWGVFLADEQCYILFSKFWNIKIKYPESLDDLCIRDFMQSVPVMKCIYDLSKSMIPIKCEFFLTKMIKIGF